MILDDWVILCGKLRPRHPWVLTLDYFSHFGFWHIHTLAHLVPYVTSFTPSILEDGVAVTAFRRGRLHEKPPWGPMASAAGGHLEDLAALTFPLSLATGKIQNDSDS
jgi:hypothetical protein